MHFYLIVFLCLYYNILSSLKGKDYRNTYIIVTSILLVALSTLRHEGVGVDTYYYMITFEEMEHTSWNSVFKDFIPRYLGFFGYNERDPGFSILEKILVSISPNARFLLFVTAVTLFSALGWFLHLSHCKLKHLLLFYVIYIVLFNGYIPNAAIRQTFAFTCVVIGYCMFLKSKMRYLIIWTLIGSLFHKTVLLVMFLVVLEKIRNVRTTYRIGIFAIAFVIFFYREIGTFFIESNTTYSGYISSDYYMSNEKPYMVLILFISLYALILFSINKDKSIEARRIYYYSSMMSVVLAPLIWLDPSLLRLVVFFYPFMGLNIAEAIDRYSMKNLIFFTLISVLALKTYTSDTYRFMWENMQLHERYDHI